MQVGLACATAPPATSLRVASLQLAGLREAKCVLRTKTRTVTITSSAQDGMRMRMRRSCSSHLHANLVRRSVGRSVGGKRLVVGEGGQQSMMLRVDIGGRAEYARSDPHQAECARAHIARGLVREAMADHQDHHHVTGRQCRSVSSKLSATGRRRAHRRGRRRQRPRACGRTQARCCCPV